MGNPIKDRAEARKSVAHAAEDSLEHGGDWPTRRHSARMMWRYRRGWRLIARPTDFAVFVLELLRGRPSDWCIWGRTFRAWREDELEIQRLRRIASENPGLLREALSRFEFEELMEDPRFRKSIEQMRRGEYADFPEGWDDPDDPLVSAEPGDDWDPED